MSDPRVSSDWSEKELLQQFSESDVVLSEDDIREILNGQADTLDRKKVNSMDEAELYQALLDRYVQEEDEAYRRQMDVFHEDMVAWTPPDMEPPLKPAQVIDFSHEVPTNYSRHDEEGLVKQRTHYGAKNPKTGEVIIHMYKDEYVEQAELED